MKSHPTVPLKDLCNNYKEDIVDGPFGANLKREHYQDQGIPVLKIQNIKPFSITLKKMDFVSEEKYRELLRHSYRDGDIIMTKLGDPLGESAIVTGIDDGLIVADLVRIRAQKVDTRYLCYHLNSPVTNAFVNSQQKGTTRPRVRISVVRELPIYLPPLDEQKRIVALLDQAFSEIDKARELTEKNLKNAQKLFDSYLSKAFSKEPGNWNKTRLKKITSKIGSGATPKGGKKSYKTEGIPLIRSMNVHDREFREKDLAFIDDNQAAKLDNVVVCTGDVLLNITGASVARCCTAPEEHLPARVNQHVSIIRVKPNTIFPELLCYLLTSKTYKDELLGIGEAGATRQAITKAQIEEFVVSYPKEIKYQRSLAKKLNTLDNHRGLLIDVYRKKLNELEDLRSSILRDAFSGELKIADKSEVA